MLLDFTETPVFSALSSHLRVVVLDLGSSGLITRTSSSLVIRTNNLRVIVTEH
jgi:hypothetical protein